MIAFNNTDTSCALTGSLTLSQTIHPAPRHTLSEENLFILNHLYAFSDRTGQYYYDREQQAYSVYTRRNCTYEFYLQNEYYKDAVVKNTQAKGSCKAACIDLDAHNNNYDEILNCYQRLSQTLNSVGIRFFSAFSSFTNDEPNGIHIYLLFRVGQSAKLIKNTLKLFVSLALGLEEYNHLLQIFPSGNLLRPFFLSKGEHHQEGFLFFKSTEAFHDCLNESIAALINWNKSALQKRRENKYIGEDEKPRYDFSMYPSGLSLEAFNYAVRERHRSIDRGLQYQFSQGFVAAYLGVSEQKAKDLIKTLKKQYPDRFILAYKDIATRANVYYIDEEAKEKAKTCLSDSNNLITLPEVSFSKGNTFIASQDAVRKLKNKGIANDTIERHLLECFRKSYDGDTTVSEFQKRIRYWIETWKPSSIVKGEK